MGKQIIIIEGEEFIKKLYTKKFRSIKKKLKKKKRQSEEVM
jgi:hypothetical protein